MKQHFNTIATPARLALWLGVILVFVAYIQYKIALLYIGGGFILLGTGLWIAYGSAASSWTQLQRKTLFILQKTPLRNAQWLYNWEATLQRKPPPQKSVLKNKIFKRTKKASP